MIPHPPPPLLARRAAAPVLGCRRMPATRNPAIVGASGVPGQRRGDPGDLSGFSSDFSPLPWHASAKDEPQFCRHLCTTVCTPRYPSRSRGQQQRHPECDAGLHAEGVGTCPRWISLSVQAPWCETPALQTPELHPALLLSSWAHHADCLSFPTCGRVEGCANRLWRALWEHTLKHMA